MKAINKLYDIWEDLDKSYSLLKGKMNCSTKKEFLEAIALSNTGDIIISKLKSLASKGQEDFNAEESMHASELFQIFDAVDLLIRSGDLDKIDEIDSLNTLVGKYYILNTSSLQEKDLTTSTLTDMFYSDDKVVTKMSSIEMFKKYKELDSFVKIVDGSLVSVSLQEDYTADLFVIVNTNMPSLDKLQDYFIGSVLTKEMLNTIGKLDKLNLCSINHLVFCKKSLIVNDKLFGVPIHKKDTVNNVTVYTYKRWFIYAVE